MPFYEIKEKKTKMACPKCGKTLGYNITTITMNTDLFYLVLVVAFVLGVIVG